MVFVKSFCFYFSCRLGSLIVGVFNITQILLWLSLCIHCLIHSQEISEKVAELLEDDELDLSDISDSLNNIKNNPEKCFNWGITFFTIFGISCIAMMYGVYKLKSYIVYPFVVIDFFYITTLLVVYVIGLLILKTNGQGLGPLILFSVIGEFLFLYKYYTWFVVLSYCQIVYDLKKQETSTINFKLMGQPSGKTVMYPNDLSLPPYPEYAMYPKKY